MYIDIHAHLETFKNPGEIVEQARKKGVRIIVAHGINASTNRKTLELAEKYEEVRAALGIYPDEILKMKGEEIEKEIRFIEKNKDNIFSVGEIGLDGTYENMERQKKYFIKQIELALKIGKPVIVHSRKAEEEVIEILEKYYAEGNKKLKVIMHCFCGNKKLVQRIISNGWFLSIPANVKYNQQFQENVLLCPVEQLFCETDSPYLHPDKKFPNMPENVIESYKKIAEIKGIGIEKVEKRVERNFRELE